ncbi:hypothetical protein ACQJBY_042407 [Aegilops geniculata]
MGQTQAPHACMHAYAPIYQLTYPPQPHQETNRSTSERASLITLQSSRALASGQQPPPVNHDDPELIPHRPCASAGRPSCSLGRRAGRRHGGRLVQRDPRLRGLRLLRRRAAVQRAGRLHGGPPRAPPRRGGPRRGAWHVRAGRRHRHGARRAGPGRARRVGGVRDPLRGHLRAGAAVHARLRGRAGVGPGALAAVADGAGRDRLRGGARRLAGGQGEDGRGQPRVRPAHHHGHRAAQQGRSSGVTWQQATAVDRRTAVLS